MDLEEMQLKNGSVLVSITGYSGETDFYTMYDIIKELLRPEEATYGVDSMCVDGSFRKDGLLVRMSSECVTDCCCFHYDVKAMDAGDIEKVKGWISAVTDELHRRLPR